MSYLRFVIFLYFAIAVSSCGGSGEKTVHSAIDSVATDVDSGSEFLLPVADTVYASAAMVKCKIDTLLLEISHKLTGLEDDYKDSRGILTFRGNSLRNADFHGHLQKTPVNITIDWTFITDEDLTPTKYGVWRGGTGWTGQPLYLEWSADEMEILRKNDVVAPGFSGKEIVVGSLAGKIYFIDYDSGTSSRNAVDAGNPIKGTVSIDPLMNGNLYFGHGIPGKSPFGANMLNLFTNKVEFTFDRDPNAWRGWGAYDSSPLRIDGYLFWPGENGSLYKWIATSGEMRLHSVLHYKVDGVAPGIESSISAWRNLGYVADNHGNIICINLSDLMPRWCYCLGDDVDATPVVAEEDRTPYLYVGCEVDHQGVGESRFVKLNALTGEEIWRNKIDAVRAKRYDKYFDGGYYATALLGSGDCEHLVMSNCVLNTGGEPDGVFVAINRNDGSEVYRIKLDYYAWSSPVSMSCDDGHTYIINADCYGNIYVIRGIDGKIMVKKKIGLNFESSPVVIGNHIVIGSRGNSIYKLSVD